MFNTIGIITKPNDDTSQNIGNELGDFLRNKGIQVISEHAKIATQAALIIVVGGDGTLLSTARSFVDHNIPILGVNLGRLGFLADISVANMRAIVTQVLAGKFIQEARHLLHCQIQQQDTILSTHLALNDAVLHRKGTLKMIEFNVFIDDKFVNTQRADGLIITTPTGSTAYALSSGGAIMHPEVDAIGIVSICPHTMSHRPLLIAGKSQVQICLSKSHPNTDATASFDGQTSVNITSGQTIHIRQHKQRICLLHPENYDYFDIIRSKLHWGHKL